MSSVKSGERGLMGDAMLRISATDGPRRRRGEREARADSDMLDVARVLAASKECVERLCGGESVVSVPDKLKRLPTATTHDSTDKPSRPSFQLP
jgi:hypothetical protein